MGSILSLTKRWGHVALFALSLSAIFVPGTSAVAAEQVDVSSFSYFIVGSSAGQGLTKINTGSVVGGTTVASIKKATIATGGYRYTLYDAFGKSFGTYGTTNEDNLIQANYEDSSGKTLVYNANSRSWVTAARAKEIAKEAGQPNMFDIPGQISALKNDVAKGIKDGIANIGDSLIKYVGIFFLIIGLVVSWVANAFLFIAAQVMDGSFKMLVRDMGTYAPLWTAVQEGWKAIRDIGNTLFIFVLLYAAFNTVLGRKDGLDLVPRILVVALLVNFSYLFATSVIDVSNEMAAKVYGEIEQGTGGAGLSGQLAKLGGYENLMKAFTIESLKSDIGGAIGQGGAAISAAQASSSVFAGVESFIKAVFSSSFVFVLGGFMLAIAFTLVARFVTLVVLCVVAALAFLAYLLPKFESHSRGWWDALIGQSFYAPAIFLMLLVTTGIAEKFQVAIGSSANPADGRLASLFTFGLSQFFTFCVLIGLLFASMKVARLLSEQGSKAALSIGQRAQKFAAAAAFGGAGFAGRSILGRAGGRLADSDTLKKWSVQSGITGYMGRKLVGVGGRMNESSFDFRQSGAATALQAAVGADYGKVGAAAQGGWKGVAGAKEKAIEARINAVQKLDLSGKDKKKKIDALVAAEAGTGSHLDNAQQRFAREEQTLSTARASGAPAATIQNMEASLKVAKEYRDDLAHSSFNKKQFGIDSSDRDMNYSKRYAQSIAVSAARMGRIKAGLAVGGLGALATFSGAGALAVGTLGAGRAISGVTRGYRARKSGATGTDSTFWNRKEKKPKVGFLGGAGADQATMAASEDYLDKYKKIEEARAKINELENLPTLDNKQKNELDRHRKTVEKHENQGKKKED